MNRDNLIQGSVLALGAALLAAPWFVILHMLDYPTDEWMGIILVFYTMLHLAFLAVNYVVTRSIQRARRRYFRIMLRMRRLAGRDMREMWSIARGDRTIRLAATLATALVVGSYLAGTVGIALLASHILWSRIGFDPLGPTALSVSIYSASASIILLLLLGADWVTSITLERLISARESASGSRASPGTSQAGHAWRVATAMGSQARHAMVLAIGLTLLSCLRWGHGDAA